MTTDLITALQTHGQQHKGTDLGGLLQWAVLHIQAQAKAAIDAALAEITEAMPAPPLDFATDHTSHIA